MNLQRMIFFNCLLCCDGFKFALQILDLILNKKLRLNILRKYQSKKKNNSITLFIAQRFVKLDNEVTRY